jgi:methyl-accepting chemotaxis protein
MQLANRSLKFRLFAGYGAVLLVIAGLTGFGLTQLVAIRTNLSKMQALSDNNVRALEITANFQAIRRGILRFNFDADEPSFKDAADREAKSLAMLRDAEAVTLSEERKAIYRDLQVAVGRITELREALGGAVRSKNAAVAQLLSVGDSLTADIAKLSAEAATAEGAGVQGIAKLETDLLLVRVANLRFLTTRDGKGIPRFKANYARAAEQIDQLDKEGLPDRLRPRLQSVKESLAAYGAAFDQASTNMLKGDDIYRNDVARLTVQSAKELDAAVASLSSDFKASQEAATRVADDTLLYQGIAAGLALLLGFVIAALTVRSILPPLLGLTKVMNALAAGDLGVRIPARNSRDEIGQMTAAVLVFQQAAMQNAELEREAEKQRGHADSERVRGAQAQQEAIEKERALVADSLGVGLDKLASQELTYRMTSDMPPAYRKLQTDFNEAVTQLEESMKAVAASTEIISSGAAQISTSASDLSHRTEQQAAALEETVAAINEITSTINKTASGAELARAAVTETRGDAKQSGEVVSRAVEAMGKIDKSSQSISQIIGVIDEIAFQTNLLALNAGVEAARAGDSGRGFAVVASEVRALAQRSAQAAKDIKALIAVSNGEVSIGVGLVAEAGASLSRIFGRIGDIDSVVGAIAASAKEQATGIKEINTAIAQMDQSTQQNAAMAEETSAASRSLSSETTRLAELMARFEIGEVTTTRDLRGELRKVASTARAA